MRGEAVPDVYRRRLANLKEEVFERLGNIPILTESRGSFAKARLFPRMEEGPESIRRLAR